MNKYPRKTTKAEFERFKESFRHYQKLFGLGHYRITFSHNLDDNAYGRINTDGLGFVAWVNMTATISDELEEQNWDPARVGKHEAIHLLTTGLREAAQERYISRDAVRAEEERLVRTLENLL